MASCIAGRTSWGRFIMGISIALGLPKGFNRPGSGPRDEQLNRMRIRLWSGGARPIWDRLNVPVWAMEGTGEDAGFLFVRTYMPRLNCPWSMWSRAQRWQWRQGRSMLANSLARSTRGEAPTDPRRSLRPRMGSADRSERGRRGITALDNLPRRADGWAATAGEAARAMAAAPRLRVELGGGSEEMRR